MLNYSLDESKIKFGLPANCIKQDEQLFEMSLEGDVRACSIKEFRNVWANRELVLWINGEMLIEGFAYPWLREKLYGPFKEKLKFKVKNTIRIAKEVKDPVLWCLDGFSTGGYFHWITDILPRLWMGRGYFPDIQFAIPDYFFTKWPFIKDYFRLLGVERFLVIENKYKYRLHELIMPTRAGNLFFLQPEPVKQGVKWLQEAALGTSDKNCGERLFISRSKAVWRKIENEQQLLPVLERYGFKVIHFEDYPLADQISICSNAKVILGLHGAGLANLVFQKPGSKVIEIRPAAVNHMYNCFFTLAPYFEVEYNYILCSYAETRLPTEKRIDDHSVVVSPGELEAALKKILQEP